MNLGTQISGYVRSYLHPRESHKILLEMAASALRQDFNACAPGILNGADDTTLKVDLNSLSSHMPFYQPNKTPKSARAQLRDLVRHQEFKDLKALAKSRGLQIKFRIEAGQNSTHPATIFADVMLPPYEDPAVQRLADARWRKPKWPRRIDSDLPYDWRPRQSGPSGGVSAPA